MRGPATLLYGANAIGGLVNVITDEIPTRPQQGATGNFIFDLDRPPAKPAAPVTCTSGTGRMRSISVAEGGGRSRRWHAGGRHYQLAVAKWLC